MSRINQPNAAAPLLAPNGTMNPAWFLFFQQLSNALNAGLTLQGTTLAGTVTLTGLSTLVLVGATSISGTTGSGAGTITL